MNEVAGGLPMTKKSLMNSIDRLQTTGKRLEEVNELTDRLISRFQRTEGISNKIQKNINGNLGVPSQPDIIDLFNNIDEKLNILLNEIAGKIEKIIDAIE